MAGTDVFSRTGFNVNDKVVCVDDIHQYTKAINAPDGLPTRGRVYCVSGVSDCGGLLLVGLRAVSSRTGKEVGFRPDRFCRVEQFRIQKSCEHLPQDTPPPDQPPIRLPETEALETPKRLIIRAIDVLEEWQGNLEIPGNTSSWLRTDYLPDQSAAYVREELRELLRSAERVPYMNHSCTLWLRLVRYNRPTVIFCRAYSPIATILLHLCMRRNLLSEALLAGDIREHDYPTLTVAVGKLACAPIRICDARDGATFLNVLRQIDTVFEFAFLDWIPSHEEFEAVRGISADSELRFLCPQLR